MKRKSFMRLEYMGAYGSSKTSSHVSFMPFTRMWSGERFFDSRPNILLL